MSKDRYSRNIGTITEEEQLILQQSHIFIAGCGGLGGYLINHLLRIGIGTITAVDCDSFDSTNLNRQLLSSTATIGIPKTEIADCYAKAINPDVHFQVYNVRLTEDNVSSLIQGCDLVLDAVDNIESRYILAKACDRLQIPFVYGAIRGWSAQIGIFPPGTACSRISLLYPENARLTDKSCLSFTPALCASFQASEATKYLLKKSGCLTDRILLLDLLTNDTEEIFLN